MKKELFKLIVAEFQKLGVNPTKWFGTRTNVKRIGKNSMANTPINEFAIKREFDNEGVKRILKLFEEESRYLAQLNDMEATQLLANLKTANKVVNPPAKPEAGIYSLKEGKKLTADEFAEKKAADQAKIGSATLKAAMETSKVDQDLAKRLNLDMSKISDFDKLQAWKKQHNVPDFTKEEGIGSLFKTVEDNPLADLGTHLDNIEKEGKSLANEAQKLVDLAWKMSPEGQAGEELFRKDILRRSYEGKGFAGGVFGARNDGFFRAVVRPFLLEQHAKGKIKLADNTLKSLKNADDLKGGGDFWSADPVRVFRQHYGDDAFDLIPNEEAFGGGKYGPTTQERIDVLEKVIGKPILKNGPETPGGYLTKGEYQAKLDHEDEVLRYINEGEGRFGDMSAKELAEEIASTKASKDSIMMAFRQDHPTANFQKKDFRTRKEWEDAEIKAQADETLDKKLEGTGVTREGFVDPADLTKGTIIDPQVKADIIKNVTHDFKGKPYEVSGIDQSLKSDFTKAAAPKKDPLNIRLMKNFDQPLDDKGLAGEGYNLQEITVLKNARNRMTTGDELHPNEALLREKELLADEAGIDVEDFDDLKLSIDWGDMTPEPMAQGGGVGSMFRRV